MEIIGFMVSRSQPAAKHPPAAHSLPPHPQ